MIKKLFNSELVKGSLVLMILMNVFNALNFLYHFISGRLLGPEHYGTLTAIMALVYIFNIPSDSIQTIISRYATKHLKDKRKIKGLMIKGFKRLFYVGIFSFILFSLLSPIIGKFLGIETGLLILTGVLLIGLFVIPVNRGILQGIKKFTDLGFIFVSDSAIKLGLTILLIVLGMKVYGAIIGLLAGTAFAFLISMIFLRKILKEKADKNVKTEGIYSYSFPVLASLIGITLFYSVDLILAKRFFSDELVGKYAVISMLGKILFFGSIPISRAMFPIISEKSEGKRSTSRILIKSLLIVLALCSLGLLVYYLFPTLVISIPYGAQYIDMAPLLIYPAIAMTLLSLSNIFIFYNLSTSKKNLNYAIIFFAIIQIILLSIFHSTLLQFMTANIFANILLLLFLLILSFKK